jgi:hypothetical protein
MRVKYPAKVYVLRAAVEIDYVALGLFYTNTEEERSFTLIFNGFMIVFRQTPEEGLAVEMKDIEPEKLPKDVKIKVVPSTYDYHLPAHVRGKMMSWRLHGKPFRRCFYYLQELVQSLSQRFFSFVPSKDEDKGVNACPFKIKRVNRMKVMKM